MKHIRNLKVWESNLHLSQDQIDILNENVYKGHWEINQDTGLVDVYGTFNIVNSNFDSFSGIEFGKVTGNFDISINNFTSLKGSPREVGGFFAASSNKITSLEGSPYSCGSFFCDQNQLTSLKGASKEVLIDFYCQYNLLTSLEGSPEEINGTFNCENNFLNSLKGAPHRVGWSFLCSENPLTSLEGAPKDIVGTFRIDELSIASKWDPTSWLTDFLNGNEKAKKLISTLPQFPEELNKEINKDPGNWVIELKKVWNLEDFRPVRDKLKVSDQFIKDVGNQSTLSDLGF